MQPLQFQYIFIINMKSKIKIDISQLTQAKLTIPMTEYSKLRDQIKKVKYPIYAFSQAEKLEDKISTFKNEKVKEKLREDLSSLNSYRKVRGDGNCFFRALGFCFISQQNVPSYFNCFSWIDQINLACCRTQSIPKQFQKFYDHKFLATTLKLQWQTTFTRYMKQNEDNKKKTLLKLLDENPYLDFILILYFRAVCLKALYIYQSDYQNFLSGDEEQSIRTYSEQTEGISLKLCSKILEISIFVYEVRKQQIKSYHYDVSKLQKSNSPPPKSVYLLFYENHYDILEYNTNIEAEKSALKRKETYYGTVNDTLIKGTCIQCQSNGYVNQQSKLCLKCHQFSLASLNDFKKEKYVRGQCAQCRYVKDNVSISFGLCRGCIQIQNQIAERRRAEQKRKERMKNCTLCNRFTQVDLETFLCAPCLNNQKKAMNMIESRRKIIQPQENQNNNQDVGVKKSQIRNSENVGQQSKVRNPDKGYHDFSCKGCHKLVLNNLSLLNGLCTSCRKQ